MKPRRTFQNLSRDKQERITRIAVDEFGEKGYQKASINTIVTRLGIAKGSIFQYFGDKKGLFLFAFTTSTERVKDYLRTVRDQTGDQPLFTRLEATLLAGFLFLKKHPVIYRLYLRTFLEFELPFGAEILLTLRKDSLKYLRSLLETARNRGELRENLDIDKACFVLDAVMDRFLQARVLPHLDAGLGIYGCPDERAREWISELIEIMRTGIGTEETP